jgi:hypothetical protein
LRDNSASPVESYYWAWRDEDAIRTADWRLHRFFDHNELHDIRTDIGETKNVADAHPDVVKSLTAKMNTWAEALGAASEKIQNLEHLAAQISGATNQWEHVHLQAEKASVAAKDITERMAAEVRDFTEFVAPFNFASVTPIPMSATARRISGPPPARR